MKKIPTAIALAVFLAYPSFSFADYVIHLKDGTRFVTDRYFEEGDQIKFKRYGGVFGIQKDRVREIEEIDIPEKNETPLDIKAPAVEEERANEGAPEDAAKGKTMGEEAAGEGKIVKEGKEIKDHEETGKGSEKENNELIDKYAKEFDLLKEKFRQVPIMTKEELHTFADELLGFRKGVLSDRLAGIFSQHLLEVYAMLDEVKDVSRLRDR
ncbi:MAG: YgdI/YgdR family lipoprotein [Deltaproteobacteria bacterium]|nr:YgdI/YgdR family lipoprotein [Deltaproteobacteria bacterium]